MGYFNLLPCKKSKICKIFTKDLEIYEQLEKINKLYLDFLYFYKKEYKKAKQYGHKNRKEELDFLGLKKLEKAFNIVLSILKFCLRTNITLNSYFKQHKKSLISRRCFYQHKLKFCNMCDRTIQNYYLHIWKPKINKTIRYVYDALERIKICNYYFETIDNEKEYYNKTNIWLWIRKDDVLSMGDKFNNLSINSLTKMIKSDSRYGNIPLKKHKNEHLFRQHRLPLGKVQLDLKVSNIKDTKLRKHIYFFNMIDTASRFTYSKVLTKADKEHVMEALNEGFGIFKNKGIKIQNIQTDNAMIFKGNNFVYDQDFTKWCVSHKIGHTYIHLMEPQSNGCIERFHRTMDQEFIVKLRNFDNLKDIQKELEKFSRYYNNERYLHYKELDSIDPKFKYMKIIDAIEYFRSCTI